MNAGTLDTPLLDRLPTGWRSLLTPYLDSAKTAALADFVAGEYASHEVFPPIEDLFTAYRLCPPEECRVVLLGQDPYHRPGQAHGLSFSVRDGVAIPPSLRSVFAELADDLGVERPTSGNLTRWAQQGVLLLNAVLTVRRASAGSHAGKGWEEFTDATIRALNTLDHRVVFLLWGNYARKKAALVSNPAHVVLEAGHPSPMNPRGFRGCRAFSGANKALADAGLPTIDW